MLGDIGECRKVGCKGGKFGQKVERKKSFSKLSEMATKFNKNAFEIVDQLACFHQVLQGEGQSQAQGAPGSGCPNYFKVRGHCLTFQLNPFLNNF